MHCVPRIPLYGVLSRRVIETGHAYIVPRSLSINICVVLTRLYSVKRACDPLSLVVCRNLRTLVCLAAATLPMQSLIMGTHFQEELLYVRHLRAYGKCIGVVSVALSK